MIEPARIQELIQPLIERVCRRRGYLGGCDPERLLLGLSPTHGYENIMRLKCSGAKSFVWILTTDC
jgi:hypothetical protein